MFAALHESEDGTGCVKTAKPNFRGECLSRIREGRRGPLVLPRRPQHASSDPTGPSCRPRAVGRNSPLGSRACEDGLEQRRAVRHAAGDDGLRQNARARRQTNGRTRLRPLPIPLLHVAVDAPRVSNDLRSLQRPNLAARLPVVCMAAHRTQSASIREILQCL